MDDLAHLLLGYALWRAMRIIWPRAGKFELAVILLASVLPDLVWVAGWTEYAQAHTVLPYLVVGALAMFWGRTWLAGLGFCIASSAHIIIDAVMHVGTWKPLAPFSDLSITASFNYWDDWRFIAAYWIGALLILYLVMVTERAMKNKAPPKAD